LEIHPITEQSTPLTILSAGAPKGGVQLCLDEFERVRGMATQISFATAPQVRQAVESGATKAAIVIATVDAIAAFDAAGLTRSGHGGVFGSVAAGVVVRAGAVEPDIATVDSLKTALRAADSVVYNIASSGLQIAAMIEKLGLTAELADKSIRPANGAAVVAHVAGSSNNDIGFGQTPEIRRLEDQGVTLIGPLPSGVEITTTYGVAVLRNSPEAAIELADFLASDTAAPLLKAAGVTRQ
jgi:molybdate transport system substrate-binding protein